ncbi:MAG: lasso peptide biosynthesis B2 protein [Actinomycetota bacterium]|nr:lasso peptide biosynthesis B2 protein [Actinomycetota bacterium]
MVGIAKGRLAHAPGAREALRFLGHLRRPTRASAVRAVIDGVFVTLTLNRRGARPLLTPASATSLSQDPQRSIQVSAAVDAGFHMIPVAPTCLRRSVTLMRELNRLGLAAAVHIGVRNVDGNVEAHAWVQAGDVVLNDDPKVTETYVELAAGELEGLLLELR